MVKLKEQVDQNGLVDFGLKLPEIFYYAKCIDWNDILENLGICQTPSNSSKFEQLETVFNKYYYSDQYEQFKKSFGIKVKNLYDLSLTAINTIRDDHLIVDEFGFVFSYYDLRKIQDSCLHPYNKKITLNQTLIYNKATTLINYYKDNMENMLTGNNSTENLDTGEYDDILDRLCNQFEKLINNEFFTTNLLTIYQNKLEHLDYTVGLLCYVLSIIEDYHFRYINNLKHNYCQESDKYPSFLKLFIKLLNSVKNENNAETYHYICIIIFKILQYRYNLICDGEELFNLVKDKINNRNREELYWSIILDRPNFICQRINGNISLININIDNIFSNCELPEYFYTLMVYLHSKYMKEETHINGKLVSILNHYKIVDNYNYLDVIRYFTNLYHQLESENSDKNKELFSLFYKMINRYYIKTAPIHITSQGLISDI